MAELKDSGERKTFDSGAMRDISEGKGRCDLLPLDTIVYILGSNPVLECIDDFLRSQNIEYLKRAIIEFMAQRELDMETMILQLAIHYEDGARKYADNNWKKGMPIHCFLDSGIRHYFKWSRGDVDEPHDRAFLWNMVGAIWMMEHKPEFNDIKDYYTIIRGNSQ